MYRPCNTNLFSTTTVVPQTHLNVTLYVQYLSYYGLFHSTRLVLIARYCVSTRVEAITYVVQILWFT